IVYAYLRACDEGFRVSMASGGHPPPMLVRPDGTVEEVPCHGLLLGVFEEAPLDDTFLTLAPGDTVVFYTDGVPDTPTPEGRFGEDGLRCLLSGCAGLPASDVASR